LSPITNASRGSKLRSRLAARAAVGGDVGADVDAAQLDALGLEALAEPVVDAGQRLLGEIPPTHARLVGDHEQLQPQLAQVPQSLGGAVDQLHQGGVGQVVPLHVERAVAIQRDDAPPATAVHPIRCEAVGSVVGHAVLTTDRHSSSLSHM